MVPVFCGVARFDVSATLVTGAIGAGLTTYAICAEACAASTVTPALRAHMITV